MSVRNLILILFSFLLVSSESLYAADPWAQNKDCPDPSHPIVFIIPVGKSGFDYEDGVCTNLQTRNNGSQSACCSQTPQLKDQKPCSDFPNASFPFPVKTTEDPNDYANVQSICEGEDQVGNQHYWCCKSAPQKAALAEGCFKAVGKTGTGPQGAYSCEGSNANATCTTNQSGHLAYTVCPKGSTAASENGKAASEIDQICQEAQQLAQRCKQEKPAADESCNPEKGQMGQYSEGVKGAARGLEAVTQSSIAMACSNFNTVMGGLNAAMIGFEVNCNSSRKSCINSCGEARQKIEECDKKYQASEGIETPPASVTAAMASKDEVKEGYNKCVSYEARLNDAKQSLAGITNSIATAKQCKEIAKSQPGLCTKDPSAPGCNQGPESCDNPAFAATNVVCICMKTGGADPRCQGSGGGNQNLSQFPNGGGNSTPTIKPNTSGLSGTGGENSGGGLEPLAGVPGPGGGDPGEDPGGKKGSGAPLNPGQGGGNSGAVGANRNGGAGESDRNASIYAGNWGGRGGGGGSFGGAGSGGRNSAGGNGFYRSPNQVPDLNKFRPGMMGADKFRPAVAGVSGPDGMTGPNTATLWQKVQNRYQAKAYGKKP